VNITNYIQCFENILDSSICDEIIKNSKDETFFSAKTFGDTSVNDSRKCYEKPINKKYDNLFFKTVGKTLIKYKEKNPFFYAGLSMKDTGYAHLLYKGTENGEYKMHVDHADVSHRTLSISFILNDNYDGGDFCFFDKKIHGNNFILKKKKASAVVFPSNFCFPHAVLPVKNGNRHSVITWIV
jgi:predicted 2-oxoglutarate/Fe(II)-dependent dioxygenase YbiX|tara:strand:- start:1371 stop:1919 length:549 start_codon:yes stop_codon:yes gene_type:complete